MELEEMKNMWMGMDSKLKENDSLKETLIREMMHKKADSSVGKLLGYDVFNVIVLILMIPVIISVFFKILGRVTLVFDIFVWYLIVLCVFSSIWYLYKISFLIKIDLSSGVSRNIYLINRYNILFKKEKGVLNLFFAVLVILAFLIYIQLNAPASLWILFACVLIAVVLFTLWTYKRIYKKNINSILQSLNEIKDLEETD